MLVSRSSSLLVALFYGPRVARNPWSSRGFEWLAASPPPTHNFETFTVERGPYDYHHVDAPERRS